MNADSLKMPNAVEHCVKVDDMREIGHFYFGHGYPSEENFYAICRHDTVIHGQQIHIEYRSRDICDIQKFCESKREISKKYLLEVEQKTTPENIHLWPARLENK